MAISADERDELRDLARRSLGDRGAALLMAGLDVADLAAMEERLKLRMEVIRAELRGEMIQLRGEFGELKGEFGELKGEFGELRGEFGELKGEFGELRGEFSAFKGGFGELRGEFGELKGFVGEKVGAIEATLGTQNRLFVASLLTILVALAVLAFSAYQLGAGS